MNDKKTLYEAEKGLENDFNVLEAMEDLNDIIEEEGNAIKRCSDNLIAVGEFVLKNCGEISSNAVVTIADYLANIADVLMNNVWPGICEIKKKLCGDIDA